MGLIEVVKALILGIVEGITEWLPVSSTGHMILVDEFLKLNVTPKFKEMFLVVIQLGAIMAVVVQYFGKKRYATASNAPKTEFGKSLCPQKLSPTDSYTR